MNSPAPQYDVLIAGGGNAALVAAIGAASRGCRVLVCEAAPRGLRGGNSRHTRNLRTAHDAPTDILTGEYPQEEYFADLMRVTGGKTNETLARLVVSESQHISRWMGEQGVRFQKPLSGTLSLSRTNPFFLGGGKTLLNTYYRKAHALGVEFRYHTSVVGLDITDGVFTQATVRARGFTEPVPARTLIAACGGFQANREWLRRIWGPAADNFLIRGTPYATGEGLRLLLDAGAARVGAADQCHAVAIDARAPAFDGGIVTRLDCVPFSIVVNQHGERFYDEGEDFWPKRYAIWGRLVARQPAQRAFAIFDSNAMPLFMPSIFAPARAGSIKGLATRLGLDSAALLATVDGFNAACSMDGPFDPAVRDGRRTRGLDIDKTNWARPLNTPPYYGYPLRPGITFTYLGVAVDTTARVIMSNGRRATNIWAAGEIMAGNVLGEGYLAGIGMTIGTVFGRIAGERAATYVHN